MQLMLLLSEYMTVVVITDRMASDNDDPAIQQHHVHNSENRSVQIDRVAHILTYISRHLSRYRLCYEFFYL